MKIKKIFMTTMVFLLCVIAGKVTDVYAGKAFVDAEPNDTYETAQNLYMNAMTYADKVSNNTNSYNYATGTLTGLDEDWYYIHNTSEEVYLTISGGTGIMYFDIVDSTEVAQRWWIKYRSSSSSNKQFTPQFTMFYVYPKLPMSEQ